MPAKLHPLPLFPSLRSRLFFLICLATLPAFLFTFFAARNERAAALARAERDALHLAHLASREHVHQIQGAQRLLLWLGEMLGKAPPDAPLFRDPDFLAALLAGYPQLSNIGVLDAEGQVLASAFPLKSALSMKDNPAVIAALNARDVATGTYIIGPIVKRPVLNLAYAVRGPDGAVRAIVFNALDLEWLSVLARQDNLPLEFSLVIADHDGRLLAYGGPAQAQIATPAGLRIPEIPDIARSIHGKMVDVDVDGARVSQYLVAAPLAKAPDLYIAVGLPYERVIGHANRVFYRTLAGLGLLTVFVVTAAFIAIELGVLRAVRTLARTVLRFGAGEFGTRAAPLPGHHELAALVAAFNSMADSLVARQAEAAAAEARLRALASRLQITRETEGARIARDLHDEIGQMLTVLKIDLARLLTHCPEGTHTRSCADALREGVARMNQQIDLSVDLVRRLSSELRPNVLDKLGLVAALEWQAHETEARTGMAVQVDAEGIEEPLPPMLSVTLFRIAQEALTNVVRHAHAACAEIRLYAMDDTVTLEIRDNGRGMDVTAIDSGDAVGITGMRERALLINGRLDILSAPGHGTEVRVCAPLAPPGEDAHAPAARG